jgi:uncharacterized protein (DUF58 family)
VQKRWIIPNNNGLAGGHGAGVKWFFGVLLLLAAALVLESELLAFAMYVLLGLLVISRFLAMSWIKNLTASRECNQDTAEIGHTIAVNVTVHNAGILPVPWVLLEDVLPARALSDHRTRLRVKKSRFKIALIRSRGRLFLNYQIEFKMRGYYQVGPLVLETGDLFGLHRRYRVGSEPHFVLVYPRVVPLEGYDLASPRPIGEVLITHRLYEDVTRIAGVRAYEAGDPLNRIHWGATAKTGQIHSKLYEPSTIAGATLVLDFHQAGYDSLREPQRSELAITAAASLAHALYQMGHQVGLVTNARDAADRIRIEGWAHDFRTRRQARASAGMIEESERLQPMIVPTRRGVEQFQRIRELLARAEWTDGLTFSQLIQETASRLPRDATVVALLAEATPETVLSLANLRRRGFSVTAILIVFSDDQLDEAMGRLLAEGIETRHLKNEEELPGLCQRQVLR